jgi:hypothetical protein
MNLKRVMKVFVTSICPMYTVAVATFNTGGFILLQVAQRRDLHVLRRNISAWKHAFYYYFLFIHFFNRTKVGEAPSEVCGTLPPN